MRKRYDKMPSAPEYPPEQERDLAVPWWYRMPEFIENGLYGVSAQRYKNGWIHQFHLPPEKRQARSYLRPEWFSAVWKRTLEKVGKKEVLSGISPRGQKLIQHVPGRAGEHPSALHLLPVRCLGYYHQP